MPRNVYEENHDLVIPIAGGGFIATDGSAHEVGDEVTIYDASGDEVGHWVSDEWRVNPEGVMGAILRCIASTTPIAKDRFFTQQADGWRDETGALVLVRA